MVDSISGKQHPNIHEHLGTGIPAEVEKTETIEKLNNQPLVKTDHAKHVLEDKASISDEARNLYLKETVVRPFVQKAMTMDEPHDADKVAYFKDLLDSGRINDYLRTLNTDTLAGELLSGPAGAFLR